MMKFARAREVSSHTPGKEGVEETSHAAHEYTTW